ncbi:MULTISPECIES: SDR family NAD(P)-dependent oxidoreductase [Caldilinea]|uniref:Glucose 1-dehydrogenase n=1 Tax=Caldilinea aerophila (strain DSM 14535 / JCM 11387 / NBRC 104270 / STL-6-O1) TaxID=926550 RepID=I0I7T8_CALAS|nr:MULTISPECIES: SDR family NAD(P)-dependent oxidoreductase [Caldilinea]BAM01326.1 glucose 1-dehydrogenase [Caldilinea aerophila DSM 14535 = NBRC 104270]GIV72667.1 MAG: oxidoreductase [Caldilinea sp.]
MEFQEKIVVITGASKGIGKAAALAFAREGARVAVADRDPAAGEATARELRDLGREALFIQVDVSQEDQVRAMVHSVLERWGRLDVLVNNAGIYMQGDVTETSVEQWEHVLRVNLTGAFLCTKYGAQAMLNGGCGVIVNVASEAGLVGIPKQVAYNVSKAGMISLTKSCAVDLARRGIRVNCVCPGTTETPLVQKALQQAPDPSAARRHLEEVRPLNRLGTPEEIATAILLLASDRMAYATGAVLSVDGGYTAQ